MREIRMNKRTRYYIEKGYKGLDVSTEQVLTEQEAINFIANLLTKGYTIALTTYVNGYNRIASAFKMDYNGAHGNGYAIVEHSYTRKDYSIMYLVVKQTVNPVEKAVDSVDN